MTIDFTKWTHECIECERVEFIDAVLWSVALSSEEINAIAAGADPRTIRPDKIVEFS